MIYFLSRMERIFTSSTGLLELYEATGYVYDDKLKSHDPVRGSLAMANSGPNTNGSQFFICHQDLSGRLPKNYTIFGQVTKGLDVVDTIANAPRNARDLPDQPVAMTSVTILDEA